MANSSGQSRQRPLSDVHSIMMEKLAQAGAGGCAPSSPSTIFTIKYKVAVYAPAERADTLPLFHVYSYVVCGHTAVNDSDVYSTKTSAYSVFKIHDRPLCYQSSSLSSCLRSWAKYWYCWGGATVTYNGQQHALGAPQKTVKSFLHPDGNGINTVVQHRWYTVIRFVWVNAKFATCTVMTHECKWKIKCAHSPLNLRILSSTSVPFTLTTVQVPNLSLTHKKRITVYSSLQRFDNISSYCLPVSNKRISKHDDAHSCTYWKCKNMKKQRLLDQQNNFF